MFKYVVRSKSASALSDSGLTTSFRTSLLSAHNIRVLCLKHAILRNVTPSSLPCQGEEACEAVTLMRWNRVIRHGQAEEELLQFDALSHRLSKDGTSHGGYVQVYLPCAVFVLYCGQKQLVLGYDVLRSVFVSRVTPHPGKELKVSLLSAIEFVVYGRSIQRLEDLATAEGDDLAGMHIGITTRPAMCNQFAGVGLYVNDHGEPVRCAQAGENLISEPVSSSCSTFTIKFLVA